MLVDELLSVDRPLTNLLPIYSECSQFLHESRGIPLFKNLPATYSDVHKVKVRLRKRGDSISEVFNKAFQDTPKLRQRSVFTYTTPPAILEHNLDLFYVFPINNYKFLYSREVTNSNGDYKSVMDTLLETFDNADTAIEMITDLLKYTYSTVNLHEGLSARAEIIFHKIPYYYALRVNAYPDYKQVYNNINII